MKGTKTQHEGRSTFQLRLTTRRYGDPRLTVRRYSDPRLSINKDAKRHAHCPDGQLFPMGAPECRHMHLADFTPAGFYFSPPHTFRPFPFPPARAMTRRTSSTDSNEGIAAVLACRPFTASLFRKKGSSDEGDAAADVIAGVYFFDHR